VLSVLSTLNSRSTDGAGLESSTDANDAGDVAMRYEEVSVNCPIAEARGLASREVHPDAIKSTTTRASLPGFHREAG